MSENLFKMVLSLSVATFYLAGLVPSAFGQCSPNPDILCYDLGPLTVANHINEAGQVVGDNSAILGTHAFVWTPAGGMVDLGTLGGMTSRATDINEAGHVVGYSETVTGEQHAFLWTPAGGMVDLGTLGGHPSSASEINEAGQVLGWSYSPTGEGHAFFWTQSDGMVDVGTFVADFVRRPRINEAGQVVGTRATIMGEKRAFFWTQSSGMVDLGTLGGMRSWADYINEAGQVMGHSETASGDRHAFVWTPAGGMVDLGTLGGTTSWARHINEAGHVVGGSETVTGEQHAFLWTPAGGMVDLGGTSSWASQINEAGQVVGTSGASAFFWTQSGGMVDLGAFVGYLNSWPNDINDAGQVVGTSTTLMGEERAFLWTQSSGMVDLGTLVGHTSSWSRQINEAGQVIGASIDGPTWAPYDPHAIVWELPLVLDKSELHFNATADGSSVTSSQTVRVDVRGTTSDTWTVTADQPWINVSPASGAGNSSFTVSVDPINLPLTSWDGTIRVSWSGTFDMTRIVRVYGAVFGAGEALPPFGVFDTPTDGAVGIRGAVALTGWALDDIEATRVEIWRDSVPGEVTYTLPWRPQVKVGDADFVEAARPDVERLYAQHPFSYRAGWGYMMLTYGLPNQGNGTYVLYAVAVDKEGNRVTFGTKTITCDNANAVTPFGTIDTPGQGGTVSGTYRNWGWVLTPQPYAIPVDGSTIQVYVDGGLLGTLNYGFSRADIQWAFPGYQNTDTAVGYFDIDTTVYENGIHTIGWIAVDDGGRAEGIGSRFFVIENTGSSPPDDQARANR